MQKLSEYVQVAEAASILGVSQNTLRTWAEEGKIPMHRNPANGYRLGTKGDIRVLSAQSADCAVGPHSLWEMSVEMLTRT